MCSPGQQASCCECDMQHSLHVGATGSQVAKTGSAVANPGSPIAMVMSLMTLCRAMPRAMTAVSSDSADMPSYMSLPMRRQAADSRAPLAASLLGCRAFSLQADDGCLQRWSERCVPSQQRGSRSLCPASLACETASRRTAKPAWFTPSCIRPGFLACIHRTGTAALMQAQRSPCGSEPTCNCGPGAWMCRTWAAAPKQAQRSPCCFL